MTITDLVVGILGYDNEESRLLVDLDSRQEISSLEGLRFMPESGPCKS